MLFVYFSFFARRPQKDIFQKKKGKKKAQQVCPLKAPKGNGISPAGWAAIKR